MAHAPCTLRETRQECGISGRTAGRRRPSADRRGYDDPRTGRCGRSGRGDALGELRHEGDRLLLAELVEDLMARAVEHAHLAVRAGQALDQGAREVDRDELVVRAMDVEQRQVAEA